MLGVSLESGGQTGGLNPLSQIGGPRPRAGWQISSALRLISPKRTTHDEPVDGANPFAVQRKVVLLDTRAGPPSSEVAVRPHRGRDPPPIWSQRPIDQRGSRRTTRIVSVGTARRTPARCTSQGCRCLSTFMVHEPKRHTTRGAAGPPPRPVLRHRRADNWRLPESFGSVNSTTMLSNSLGPSGAFEGHERLAHV